MKHTPREYLLGLLSAAAILTVGGCETTEVFDLNGKRTSRVSKPSPQTWTTIGNAVATFGATAVTSWTKQMADQQAWEKGQK